MKFKIKDNRTGDIHIAESESDAEGIICAIENRRYASLYASVETERAVKSLVAEAGDRAGLTLADAGLEVDISAIRAETVNIAPNWEGMRKWVLNVARTNLKTALKVNASMGSEGVSQDELSAASA